MGRIKKVEDMVNMKQRILGGEMGKEIGYSMGEKQGMMNDRG